VPPTAGDAAAGTSLPGSGLGTMLRNALGDSCREGAAVTPFPRQLAARADSR
jgi:hypothetical protein